MAIDAGTISAQVRVALDKLKGDVVSVDTEMNKIGNKADQTASSTEKSFSDSFGAMSLAGVAAFAAITMAMKSAISVSGEYEQSIANVQSVVMGARDVFLELDEAAKQAGETTRFTASQAADAMYDLASGGLSAKEVVSSLNGVLMLAGATQADLAATAGVVVATLNQYNMTAGESTRISNVFAASIAGSMATMEKLINSMRMAGPVASALGISFEETVGALEALYDAGFRGEQAGTSLRMIMSALAAETDPTTQKLMALGLTFEQLNPAANKFADVIGNIADAGATAGEIMAAFGTRAGAQMLTLLSSGKKGLEDYTAAITGTDTAAKMYAIQNDTLKGSLDRLKSAAESAQIEFVEEFTPAMRGALEMVTGLLVAISALPGPLKIFFAILLTGTPIILGLAKAFSVLKLAFLSMAGPVGIAVTAFLAVTAGIVSFASAMINADVAKTEKDFGKLAKEVGLTADEMKRLAGVAKDLGLDPKNLKKMADEAGVTTGVIGLLNDAIDRFQLQNKSVIEDIPIWAESFDMTSEAIMRALLIIDKLSAADRKYIEGVLAQIDADAALAASKKASADGVKELADAEKAAAAEKEKGMKDAKRLATEAANAADATYADIDRRLKLGVITEAEANKEKKKAIDTYIESMLDLNQKYINVDSAVQYAIEKGKILTGTIEGQTEADKAAADAITAKKTATDQANESVKSFSEATENLGKSEAELLVIQQRRAIAAIEGSKADDAAKKAAIDSINAYYTALVNQTATDKVKANTTALTDSTADYVKKLEALKQTSKEAMDAERTRAIAAAKLAGAVKGVSSDDMEANIAAINEYFDLLEDGTAEEKMVANTKIMVSQIGSLLTGLAGSLESLFSAIYDQRIADLEAELEAELEAANVKEDTATEAAQAEFDRTQQESTDSIAAIQKRLDAALRAGDLESAAALQDSINKQLKLDTDLLAEKQAAVDRAKIEADYAEQKKALEFEAAMASWRLQLAGTVASAAQAVVNALLVKPWWAALIAVPTAIGIGGVQIAAVSAAKPKLATGGIVLPQGGGRNVTLAENGYPELALNSGPSGEALMGMFASKIVEQMGSSQSKSLTINLQVDRKTLSSLVVDDINNGRVRLSR